jgi:hypothetical protein
MAAPPAIPANSGCRCVSLTGMSVAYTSRVRIERIKGTLRRVWLPAEPNPVFFSVHGAVAEHYKAAPGTYEEHATSLDYIVAAAAG